MTQRGIFQFAGSTTLFRISKPGVDVLSAAPEDLLISEGFLTGQIMLTGVVQSSNIGGNNTQSIPIVNLGANTILYVFADYESATYAPSSRMYTAVTQAKQFASFWIENDRFYVNFPANSYIAQIRVIVMRATF